MLGQIWAQPAAGNLSSSCRQGRAACQASWSADPCSTPPGEGATSCWDWTVTFDMDKAGLHTPCCMLGQAKGGTAPEASLQPRLCPPSTQTPSLPRVLREPSERDPCFMSVSGHICATNSRAELRHPVLQFYSSQVFLISQGCTTS